MKLDSAEPETDMPGNVQTEEDAHAIDELTMAGGGKARNFHDIRASLAVINGYSLALNASFKELKEQYDQVLENKDGLSDSDSSARLMTLEADCRFCLSRLCSSVDQLKERLDKNNAGHQPSLD